MEQIYLTKKRLFSSMALGIMVCSPIQAQNIMVQGTVVDSSGEPLIGATISLKGRSTAGTVCDMDGRFSMEVPSEKSTLIVTYVGMDPQEVRVGKQRNFTITLTDNTTLGDVVVVGYGQQKKASVVGAITQTTGKVLERAAGVSDLGAALTGNLPGVVTTQSSGMPGEEEPQIIIRGASSWNNSDPLVLVDGIERPMSSVDVGSVASISVLKDASATAVYGVKGANGVILITTKRGTEGAAKIDVSFTATMKSASKLPNKLDSYDALMARNSAAEHELPVQSDSYAYLRPQSFIDNYRNQTTVEQQERYPNVDWQDALFKNSTMSYHANINVSGGTKFVKYFAAADYVSEGDLFRVYDNGRGYNSGYGYDRLNVRSNLDFQITKTTTFKVNLAGSTAIRKAPWSNTNASEWAIGQQWAGAYNIAPDVFLPIYSDGSWGQYPNASNVSNSASQLSLGGVTKNTTTRVNTDFTLEQDLSFITKGLSARGTLSWDNLFVETSRGINDLYNNAQQKWIDPDTGLEVYANEIESNNKFDWTQAIEWSTAGGSVDNSQTLRNVYYSAQLNWARKFDKHDVTAMGLFSRQEQAIGSVIPTYREDWAFRTTYNYDGRYSFEYNGAYNGSEKFSKDNRFAFFNSGAIGWTISEEKFMKYFRDKKIVDMLKFRASYGEIGNDNIGNAFDSTRRWLYMSQWAYGGNARMNTDNTRSIYTYYRESSIGNANVKWETVKKFNFGVDFAFLGGLVAGSFDVFRDKRDDILIFSADRSVPSYFGGTAPTANLGSARTTGYELELRFNKTLKNGIHLWANMNMTHARNKILMKEDPELTPAYQKAEGFPIGQYTSHLDAGFINNIDQLYGAPSHDSNNDSRLVGDYYIIDFNADGVVDSKDAAPYGYSSSPENTYNATFGIDYKGWSAFVQFYGVTNVTRDVSLSSFGNRLNNVYDIGQWWSAESGTGDVVVPRFGSTTSSYTNGTQYLYDGSYIRLKNVEIAYTFTSGWIKKLGMSSLKIFANGNNLWLWTRMPDDRESNLSGASYIGAYPTMRRFNLGLKFSL